MAEACGNRLFLLLIFFVFTGSASPKYEKIVPSHASLGPDLFILGFFSFVGSFLHFYVLTFSANFVHHCVIIIYSVSSV